MDLNDPEPAVQIMQATLADSSPPPPPSPNPEISTRKGHQQAPTVEAACVTVVPPTPKFTSTSSTLASPVVHFASAMRIPTVPLKAFQDLPDYEVDNSDSSSDDNEDNEEDDRKCFFH